MDKFEVGEVAVLAGIPPGNPHAHFNGGEVTVTSESFTDPFDGDLVYAVRAAWLPLATLGWCCPLRYLRKRRPPPDWRAIAERDGLIRYVPEEVEALQDAITAELIAQALAEHT